MKPFSLGTLPMLMTSLSVRAHPVDTSLGTEPHVIYTGHFMDLGVTSVTLLTVSVGQDLLVNTALCNGNCILSIDGNLNARLIAIVVGPMYGQEIAIIYALAACCDIDLFENQ